MQAARQRDGRRRRSRRVRGRLRGATPGQDRQRHGRKADTHKERETLGVSLLRRPEPIFAMHGGRNSNKLLKREKKVTLKSLVSAVTRPEDAQSHCPTWIMSLLVPLGEKAEPSINATF